MKNARHGARGARHGFTIVELLMVIGIIAVLMGIITTAASSSIRASRSQRANALCTIVQTALATYREQKGEWPIQMPKSRSNDEGANSSSDADVVILNASEVRKCVKALVDEAKKNNPMMDISGLFVSRDQGERNTGASFGMDFMSAIRGTRKSQKKMKTAEMYFGYPESEHGWFRRFKMTYSIPSDQLTVSQQAADDR